MLRRLSVRNLAVLAGGEIELGPGLNVLTGETGAGKSLVVDSLALLAGARGYTEIVQLALARNPDFRLTNRYGGTALIPAAERGHVEVVRELLTRTKVDVNHVNNLGWTALLEAIVLSDGGPRHQRIVELLLAHGADVNIADRGGVTPLAHAKSRGYAAIAAMLVKAGARCGNPIRNPSLPRSPVGKSRFLLAALVGTRTARLRAPS